MQDWRVSYWTCNSLLQIRSVPLDSRALWESSGWRLWLCILSLFSNRNVQCDNESSKRGLRELTTVVFFWILQRLHTTVCNVLALKSKSSRVRHCRDFLLWLGHVHNISWLQTSCKGELCDHDFEIELEQVMRDGTIVQSSQYQELLESGLDFESLVKIHNKTLESVDDLAIIANSSSWDEGHPSTSITPLSSSCESSSASYFPQSLETSRDAAAMSHCDLLRPSSQPLMSPLFVAPTYNVDAPAEGNSLKLIEDEERATGCVSGGVYRLYLTTACGGTIALVLVLSQVVWQFFQISSDYWVAYQTSAPAQEYQPLQFLAVYAELSIACVLCVLIRSSLVAFTGLLTSQEFYLKMLRGVFNAPMAFFDTTPTGRMLSRVRSNCPPKNSTSSLWMWIFCIGILKILCAGGFLVNWHLLSSALKLSILWFCGSCSFLNDFMLCFVVVDYRHQQIKLNLISWSHFCLGDCWQSGWPLLGFFLWWFTWHGKFSCSSFLWVIFTAFTRYISTLNQVSHIWCKLSEWIILGSRKGWRQSFEILTKTINVWQQS